MKASTPSEDLAAGASARPAVAARIYTVPPGRPFLRALAEAVLGGHLPAPGGRPPSPLELPDITLMLPTRRASRGFQDAFLAAAGRAAALLPRIRPIAEGEEELTLLSGLAGLDTIGAAATDVPPAVSEMERRLVLTQLVVRWSKAMREAGGDPAADLGPHATMNIVTPAQAAHLAAELGRLMDMVETESVVLAGLEALVPETFSEHWQKTLDFLKIVTGFWPAHLKERGFVAPADRRNRLILAEARRLAASPPSGPVIVAGVTGSIPATAELMREVARLDNGAIVLPGLDMVLDDESWHAIVPNHPEHPQYRLKKLLDTLGVTRHDVQVLPGASPAPRQSARASVIAEAMRPAATTGRWHTFGEVADKTVVADALAGVSLIEAPGAQDEAEAVALILREAAETPGRTAALVSPDRLLARRVAIRLEAWGIRADDSAGRPFAKTVPGAFVDLVIDAQAKSFAPPELMALLKHPLTRLGLSAFAARRAARALELAVFRAPYLGRGLDDIAVALDKARAGGRQHSAVRRLWLDDWQGAHQLVERLAAAFKPLTEVFARRGEQPLRTFAAAHVAAAEALARLPDEEGLEEQDAPLWQNEAGEAAALFFASLLDAAMPAPEIAAADYADFYRNLIGGLNVRSRVPVHPRLFIWGPFEARLQQTDVMVLGSLNEGTWPGTADPGPWLNRPMRKTLGLPSPEETIGDEAHDFTSLLGAERVYLTRALKIDGVPTVPSRWLMRLQALLGGLDLKDALKPDVPWLAYARARDAADKRPAVCAPEPRPALDLRPRKMSVSKVETWIGNPYAIFAGEILKLDPLPELGASPDASLRGRLVHEALSRFSRRHPERLPPDPKRELLDIAREVLSEYTGHARVAAFWIPRFERFAEWFAETEAGRRSGVTRVAAEVAGAMVFAAPGGAFTLTARADRIDVGEGELIITDYKTGTLPKDRWVTSHLAPQLPLEAAIAVTEGFAEIPKSPVDVLRYIRASGAEPPGEEHDVKCDDVAALAAEAHEKLGRLVASFDVEATPYKALRRARFKYDYDEYAHLARVAEWSVQQDEAET